jgi:small subunit ribosomal protein S6
VRQYEIMVVMRGDLSDEDRTNLVDTVQNWITNSQGQVVKVDHWGRRRLAYQIGSQRDGYYTLFTAELPAAAPGEIERNLRITENVLRFLITRVGE